MIGYVWFCQCQVFGAAWEKSRDFSQELTCGQRAEAGVKKRSHTLLSAVWRPSGARSCLRRAAERDEKNKIFRQAARYTGVALSVTLIFRKAKNVERNVHSAAQRRNG